MISAANALLVHTNPTMCICALDETVCKSEMEYGSNHQLCAIWYDRSYAFYNKPSKQIKKKNGPRQHADDLTRFNFLFPLTMPINQSFNGATSKEEKRFHLFFFVKKERWICFYFIIFKYYFKIIKSEKETEKYQINLTDAHELQQCKITKIWCSICSIKVIFVGIILLYICVCVCWYVCGELCAYIHRIHWIEKKIWF